MAARLGVNSGDIQTAAINIVKRGSDLTVAAVARELECKPPSIYHHVPDGLFGLNEMVNRHCRQWLLAEMDMRESLEPHDVMLMMWNMGRKQRCLYDFHSEEWEYVHDLRRRLPTYLLPLLSVMTHDYAAQLLKEIFDAE